MKHSLTVFPLLLSFALYACAQGNQNGKDSADRKSPSKEQGSSNALPGQYDEDYIGIKDPELGGGMNSGDVEKPIDGAPMNPDPNTNPNPNPNAPITTMPVIPPPNTGDKPMNEPEPVIPPPVTTGVALSAFKVTATDGTEAVKGKPIRISITLYNDDNTEASISITPFLERTGLTDYTNLELPPISGVIGKKETKNFDLIVPVFFSPQKSTAQFALASGPYRLDFKLAYGQVVKDFKSDQRTLFRIAPSRVVLTAFGYRDAYVRTLNWEGRTPAQYLDYIVEGSCSIRQSNGSLVKAPRCIQDAGKFSYMAKPIIVTQPSNGDGVTMLRQFETKLGFTKSGLDSRVHGHGFDKFVVYDSLADGFMVGVGNGILFKNTALTEQEALWANWAMISNFIYSWDRCTNYPGSEGTIGCSNPPNGIFSTSLAAAITRAVDNLMKD